jgi:hypothetical protein
VARTFFIVLAPAAEPPATVRAGGEAARADAFLADRTGVEARQTGGFLAVGAIGRTVVAEVFLAGGAEVRVVAAHDVTAVAASDAVPILQRHIGGVLVVGGQDRADQHEEVTDATARQGRIDRRPCIASAEPFAADVRMGDLFVAD